ncbi:MAG: RNA-guided endonuclease IscB [Bullifex sp.]|nr:RNA-guided endonuclease IscB [Bullifex sp.]
MKQHGARRVRNTPFTIRLKSVVDGHVQPVSLGVDPGYRHIGLSSTTDSQVLFEAVAECRTDIPKLMEKRLSLRRGRRHRRTRYREQRFDNRIRSKHRGWLAPSVEQRIGYHIHLIGFVCRLLPVSRIVVEEAKFDIHRIQNPDVEGFAYQQGPQYGFDNVKEYVRWRDEYRCRKCRSKTYLEVHHIVQRKDGGPDRPDNLVTLCHYCHTALHRGEFTLRKPKGGYKAPTFMGVMRHELVRRLREKYGDMVSTTYGYLTKLERIKASLAKDHNTDARAISGNAEAKLDDAVWNITKHRCHNRRLHREVPAKHGRRQAAQATHRVFGFGLHDRVVALGSGQTCRVSGLRTSGYFALRTLNDNTLLNLNCSRLRLLERAGGLIMVPSASSSS